MSLRSLSNAVILSRMQRLTRCERSLTLRVLLCLNEIERRQLHYQLGYRSLFHFCTQALGYSEPTAGRRIQTARALAQYPDIEELLTAGRVTVCAVAKVAGILTPENQNSILGRISGRTLDEVDAIVAEYRPCEKPRERVKVIAVPVPAASAAVPLATPSATVQAREPVLSDSCATPAPEVDGTGPAQAPVGVLVKQFVFKFSAGEQFMAKIEQVRSLAGHRLAPNASLEQVFEFAMNYMITRESPAARSARRASAATAALSLAGSTGSARHIPARLRDEVFLRDRGCCTYVSPHGRRCESARLLQIDHIVPVARGGRATIDNLRVLCAYHNRLEAERLGLPGRPARGAKTATARADANQARSH